MPEPIWIIQRLSDRCTSNNGQLKRRTLQMSLALINPIDRDALRAQFRQAKPVPWLMIDNFLRSDFAEQCAATFPTYDQVQKLGVTHSNLNERGKFQVTDATAYPPPLKRLEELLNGQEFLELVEHVTGMSNLLADRKLTGGGLHATGSRGHLDVHLDFNVLANSLHRRLNILVYLNPGWKQEWGGEFELWNESVTTCEQRFLPLFNRCVMFETNEISYHGVSAVKCPAGEARKSFAAYYYTEKAPAHFPGHAHGTVFKPRPEEKLKAILMPVERKMNRVQKFVRRCSNKLKTVLANVR